MISVAIKTADRYPRVNYLRQTLNNLQRAGVFDSHHLAGDIVLMDSGIGPDPRVFLAKEADGFLRVRIDSEFHRTLHQNAANAIRVAAQEERADWVLVLEDDIDVCARFLESVARWLEDYVVDGPMLYSFGANYAQIRACKTRGESVWFYPCHAFYGALACAWRRGHASSLAEWLGQDPGIVQEDGGKVRNRGHDLLLGQWGKVMGLTHFRASVPCFIQHIGLESGLNNKKIEYAGWCGPSWCYA